MSDPRYYHDFEPNREGRCKRIIGRDGNCALHAEARVHQHKGEPLTDVERRYRNDPIFHAVVQWMLALIQFQVWSLQDLRDAVYVVERIESDSRRDA